GAVVHAGAEGGDHGEIRGRLDQPHAAGHVDEDVEVMEGKIRSALQYGEQDREPLVVEAGRHPLRSAETGARSERLNFDENGATSFHEGGDGRATAGGVTPREKRSR